MLFLCRLYTTTALKNNVSIFTKLCNAQQMSCWNIVCVKFKQLKMCQRKMNWNHMFEERRRRRGGKIFYHIQDCTWTHLVTYEHTYYMDFRLFQTNFFMYLGGLRVLASFNGYCINRKHCHKVECNLQILINNWKFPGGCVLV